MLCHAFGTNFAPEHAKLYRVNASVQLITARSDEFVNDTSIRPKPKGIIFKIANCSSGEKNIFLNLKKAEKDSNLFTQLLFFGY